MNVRAKRPPQNKQFGGALQLPEIRSTAEQRTMTYFATAAKSLAAAYREATVATEPSAPTLPYTTDLS